MQLRNYTRNCYKITAKHNCLGKQNKKNRLNGTIDKTVSVEKLLLSILIIHISMHLCDLSCINYITSFITCEKTCSLLIISSKISNSLSAWKMLQATNVYYALEKSTTSLKHLYDICVVWSVTRAWTRNGYRNATKRKWSGEDSLQLSVLPVIPRSCGRFNIDSENIRNLSARAGRCRDREFGARCFYLVWHKEFKDSNYRVWCIAFDNSQWIVWKFRKLCSFKEIKDYI